MNFIGIEVTTIINALFIVANMRVSNGVTSVIMNNYDILQDSGFLIDFCALLDRPSPYIEYIEQKGSLYSIFPQNQDNTNADYSKALNYLMDILKRKRYDIVHVHIEGKFAAIALKAAKKSGVPYRVYHCHNPLYYDSIRSFARSYYFRGRCLKYANEYYACSTHAGKSVFGNRHFWLVRNTIDTQRYCFDKKVRNNIRKEFVCNENTLVVGTVCRQTPQKNPFYTIDIWNEIYKKNPDVLFIWIGTGELEKEVKKYAEEVLPKEVVRFLGNRTDVEELYSFMDIFLLPSLYEGLGIVYIEAQACGTLTFASNSVSRDTEVTDRIHYIPLDQSPTSWADIILNVYNQQKYVRRDQYHLDVRDAGYDCDSNNDFYYAYKSMLRGGYANNENTWKGTH